MSRRATIILVDLFVRLYVHTIGEPLIDGLSQLERCQYQPTITKS